MFINSESFKTFRFYGKRRYNVSINQANCVLIAFYYLCMCMCEYYIYTVHININSMCERGMYPMIPLIVLPFNECILIIYPNTIFPLSRGFPHHLQR